MVNGEKPGYKRPPKAHQFAPGTSGNPRGRPKGSRNLRTDLAQLMRKTVAVRENGKRRRISRQEAMLLSLYDKALHGDVKAATSIISMILRLDPTASENIQDQDHISDTDAAIIEDFIQRHQDTVK